MTQRCDMTRAGERCTNLIVPNRMTRNRLCPTCIREVLDELARDPAGYRQLVDLVAARDVAEARGRVEAAAIRAEQNRAERRAAEREADREATAVHVVYYVRTGDRTIKIGTTGHLTERMRAFRVANPDNLLAAEPGSYQLEHERHHQFRAWRYHRRREDFGDADELLAHIAAVRAEHGDPWTVGGAR